MFEFPIEKYRFYRDGAGRIIAKSTYAGQVVSGSAMCSPNDTFNEEFGMRLAAARCNMKVAHKRTTRLAAKLDAINSQIEALERQYDNISEYLDKAYEAEIEADQTLRDLLGE